MSGLAGIALAWVLAQPAATPTDEATRAAQAAERAAAAAERAATAAQAAAEAAAKAADRAAPAAQVAPVAVEPTVPTASAWCGTAGLSLISLTGNASTLTLNGNAAIGRQWRDWAFGFKAFGTYGQARASGETGDAEVVAMAAGGQLKGERRVTERVSIVAGGGAETNHVKSLELMAFGEAGAGIAWWDLKEEKFQKALLRTDLSVRYAKEYRYQYYPTPLDVDDVDLLGPRVAIAFRYALTHDILFTQDAEVIPNVLGDARFLFNATSKLASRLTDAVALGVSFVLNHDSAPAPGKVATDTALSVGVEVAL